MKINRIVTNLCSKNPTSSKEFYAALFNFNVSDESDWFIHLVAEEQQLEIGIIKSDHELVPEEFRETPVGIYITLVVNNAVTIFEKTKKLGIKIIKTPELTFSGQKRVLLKPRILS
ncbi:MAG: hypothetical protein GXP08_09340 [Gammaproteobacteria bacterium]|nr:hypothetical protein [Gammaproteobacteria bacterium]